MTFRDITGNEIKQGDSVLFSLGLGQMMVAKIASTESGLNPQNPQAAVRVTLDFTLPAAPNGLVPGLVRLPDQPSISQ